MTSIDRRATLDIEIGDTVMVIGAKFEPELVLRKGRVWGNSMEGSVRVYLFPENKNYIDPDWDDGWGGLETAVIEKQNLWKIEHEWSGV